jgi:long-chain acyl-CoA synthetase
MEYSTLYEQLRASALAHPKDEAARFENKTWTYTAFLRQVDKAARKLERLGVKENDVIAVSLPNCPDALFLLYAINKVGAVSYNIHPLTPPAQMKGMLEKAKASMLFVLSLSADRYRKEIPLSFRLVAINPYRHVEFFKMLAVRLMSHSLKGISRYWMIRPVLKSHFVPANRKKEDDAVYLNTGGTNGEPKIVRLSNGAINTLAFEGYPLVGGDVRNIKMLTAIPLFHGFGLSMGAHTILSIGGSTILMMKFKTKDAIKLLKKGYATCIIGVPALYNALLSRDAFYGPWLQKQNTAFVGGDAVPDSLLERWNAAMEKYGSSARLYEGYGLSETCAVSNVNYRDHEKFGTVGEALPGLKEIIISTEDQHVLGPNEEGEILISGNSVMSGYLNAAPEEGFLSLGGVKYLRTGDYGSLDEEGYLTYRQRLRRTVKVNGETLCPSDIESIALNDPDVYDAYAYAKDNARKGHVFRLAIVLRRGDHPADPELVKARLAKEIETKLVPSYQPEKIVVLTKIPHTPIGKIDNKAIEELEKQGIL